MNIHRCSQLSETWWDLHRGRVSASQMDRILTQKTLKPSEQQSDLICEMIAQTFSHEPMGPGDQYVSPAMMNGVVNEPEARRWYSLEVSEDVEQIGCCITDCGRFLASPDGLVGTEGGLELKCPMLKTQAKYLLKGELPTEYRAQIHGQLLVTERKWIDFFSYAPGLPPFRIRVFPDEFTELLRAELNRFWDKYVAAVERMKTA